MRIEAQRTVDVIAHLRNSLSTDECGRGLCVAYSGGADSTALLHALARLPQARARGLRAIHIDHGLHPDSARWVGHCARFCAALKVPLTVLRVEVDTTRGQGLEAAARRARYAAFAQSLDQGEWLALAHHRDDQIETVLLKLLRGAGPQGLGGMRARRPLTRGWLWRPLLEVPRAALHDYVAEQDLPFIEDPSNAQLQHSRNFLRAQILPLLLAHWPQAATSVAHSAALCRSTAELIDSMIDDVLTKLRGDHLTLDASGWSALPDALRAGVLERWLLQLNLSAPTQAQAAELKRQINQAQADRVPRVAWPGAEVRLWRGVLHAMPPLPPLPENWESAWDGAPLALPPGCGRLLVRSLHADRAPLQFDPPLLVRFRRGGERIKPAGDAHTRQLRDLFQRAAVPPWRRERMPLIWSDDELLAVADRWQSEAGVTYFGCVGAKLEWNTPAID